MGGLLLAWRETVVGRWTVLVALASALLSGWMLAQAEGLHASLAADVSTVAERGAGGFVALAAALLATGLALVPVPGGRTTGAPGTAATPAPHRTHRP